MKAVAILDINKADVIEVSKPIINENQILMKVKMSALCTTEQRCYTGEKKVPFPFVGGHEISGVIEEIGSNVDPKEFPIGSKCIGRTQIACGTCYHCRRGEYAKCTHLADFRYNGPECYGYGGLGEYIALNKNSVWIIPDDIKFEDAALCEPVACVLNSLSIAKPKMGDDALVIGGGIMGQIHLMLLKKLGVRTILSEPNEERRKFALEHGCDIVIDPTKENLEEKIKQLTNGVGVETVINTTAIPAVEQTTLKLVSSLGTVVTYSSQHPDSPVEFSPNWLHNSEAKLTGSVNPSIQTFTQAVNVICKKIINTNAFVSKIYDINDCDKAFQDALSPKTYRVLIKY